MDPEELKELLRSSGADLWLLIDTAITIAAKENGDELRLRRDSIVERLYSSGDSCRNCDAGDRAVTPLSPGIEEEDDDRSCRLLTDEEQKSRILVIKEFIDDGDQAEDSLVRLLQNLADMDITFRVLKETDIGRNVNGLRKHPSNEVRALVKHLVRKWKDTVDEWVKTNSGNDAASPAAITDGDSPQQATGKQSQIGHQVQQDLGHSPYRHNGRSSSERNSTESVPELKVKSIPPRREAPAKPTANNRANTLSSTAPAVREQKDNLLDPDRFASARKRLQENYQEAENAKRQRKIQVMDIHDIPKKGKNSIGNKGFQAKHW